MFTLLVLIKNGSLRIIFFNFQNLSSYLLSSPAAYTFPYWRFLTAVISAAYLLFLPMIYFCPASPKWLHIKGKSSKVEKVIRVFAKKTNVQIDDSLLENLEYERFGSIFENKIPEKPSRTLCLYFWSHLLNPIWILHWKKKWIEFFVF